MKKIFVFALIGILSCNFSLPANADSKKFMVAEEISENNFHPNTIIMPSTNYNQRPEGTKIDTIIIHHTAPFSSLTRVGYFFQDITSRVSSHYIVGREGLIIESVNEKDRAWHAGTSSWRGKYNVNDYSIGIEVLNDGDNKDPFTELQYASLAKLVAYLMKKYDVPISRVIGHRDIAIPLGRKTDPADNFDWKAFKARIRNELKMSSNFMGFGDLPQESNVTANDIVKGLKSESIDERSLAVDSLLTFPYKMVQGDIDFAFSKEYSETVMSKFFRLFEAYEEKKYIDAATGLLGRYNAISVPLFTSVAKYLSVVDKDKSLTLFTEIFNSENLDINKKISLIRIMGNYKDDKVKTMLVSELAKAKDNEEKKVIIESLAIFENIDLNPLLLSYLSESTPVSLKITTIDTLRTSFDDSVENRLIEVLKRETNKDLLEITVSTLMRKDSKKAITILQNEDIYKKLNDKTKIMLINSISRLKSNESENWLLSKFSKEENINLKASEILSLGKLKGDKSFPVLFSSFGKDSILDSVVLRALSNYDRNEVSRLIRSVIEKNAKKPLKMTALSIAKENKMTDLLMNLKALSVENSDPDINMFNDDVIKYLEAQ